jgi:hypothetical protein
MVPDARAIVKCTFESSQPDRTRIHKLYYLPSTASALRRGTSEIWISPAKG